MIQIFFHDTNIFFLIHIFFEFHNTRQIYVITRNINTAIVTTVSMVSGVKEKNGVGTSCMGNYYVPNTYCIITYILCPGGTQRNHTQLTYLDTAIHSYKGLYTAIYSYTQLYTAIHSYTQTYRAIHIYTYLCRAIQSYTDLYTGLHSYT